MIEFEQKESAIKIVPDLERSKSLLKSSEKTFKFAESHKLTKENCGDVLRNYYESLIQVLHAHAYKEGFKILDHITFSEYILKIFSNEYYSKLFDKYRRIRNSLIYYGENIPLEIAQQGIKEISELIKFIKSNFQK